MRISDWSSDVCSSDLGHDVLPMTALQDAPCDLPSHSRPGEAAVGLYAGVGESLASSSRSLATALRRVHRPGQPAHERKYRQRLPWHLRSAAQEKSASGEHRPTALPTDAEKIR